MIRRIFYAGVVATLALSTVGCTATNPTDSGTTNTSVSETLTVAIPADVEMLDPAVTMDNAAWKISYPAYERLVGFKAETTELQPELATSWTPSEDGKTWTFTLESGHKFSDGNEVDANAIKFSFDRLLKINKGPAGNFTEVASVEATSPTEVRFTLKAPFAAFVSKLATNGASIVNPKVMDHEQAGDLGQAYLSDHTMGSGIYELQQHIKGQSLTLVANKNFTGTAPAISKVVFKVVADSSAQRLQLENGDVDIAEGITTDQIAALTGKSGITVVKKPSLLVNYLYMNVGSSGAAGLKHSEVRQAISYGIDYDGIIQASQKGNAVQMRGPIPQGMTGYDDGLFQYDHDPVKAKQLLASAGVGSVGPLTLLYSDHQPWWPTEALAIQANLEEVGIEVKLNQVDYATERALLDQGTFDLALGVWSPDYADPYMFMNFWFDSEFAGLAGNRAFYNNSHVDNMLRQAATSTDEAERLKLYSQVQKAVVDDPPYAYLYQREYLLPIRSSVSGFVYNPMLEGIYNLAEMTK